MEHNDQHPFTGPSVNASNSKPRAFIFTYSIRLPLQITKCLIKFLDTNNGTIDANDKTVKPKK